LKWRARISPNSVIIVAASARAFVRAAATTGRRVIAADAFSDVDTRSIATRSLHLGYANGGFLAEEVRSRIVPLLSQGLGLVYGSGFESQPELLEELSRHGTVYGNSADTVRLLKSPDSFFALLSSLQIPFPEWSLHRPREAEGWLHKRIGGSGGTHVVPASSDVGGAGYYQRKVAGEPISLLFLADGAEVLVVGYNRQLLAPTIAMPCRYGGAVSQIELASRIRCSMLSFAANITRKLGLRGLNSLDCMVDGDDVRVLEINPRLSATFALYDAENSGASLFEAHLQACAGELSPALSAEPSQAHLIYYAPFDLAVPAAMVWPDWVADVPEPASICRAEEPLCTVMASAANADEAYALARARTAALTALLTNLNQTMERS
jgi:predicted ATP-grasp superfamily ATP-dependent carboligase